MCAGRTDSGVHATGQIVHFDTNASRPVNAWVRGTNTCLPPDVAVLWARDVDDAFHARFSALGRRYRYVIVNRDTPPCASRAQGGVGVSSPRRRRMHLAAQHLAGEHDFSSFRASGCQASRPVRRVFRIDVTRTGDRIFIDVHANAFLQHMVRNFAGSLMAVGAGVRPPEWIASVLAARDRRSAGVTAVPQGVYLVGVDYPAIAGIPAVPTTDALW